MNSNFGILIFSVFVFISFILCYFEIKLSYLFKRRCYRIVKKQKKRLGFLNYEESVYSSSYYIFCIFHKIKCYGFNLFLRKEYDWVIELNHPYQTYFPIFSIDSSNGDKIWCLNGTESYHRNHNLPAIEYANGNKEWWYLGSLHREEGLPAIEYSNGDKEWWWRGKRHRYEGPAIIYGNYHFWFKYGDFVKLEVKNEGKSNI